MFITEEKLNELFNAFGISYSIDNGNVQFVDVETNTPLNAFRYDRWGKKEENDPNTVFDGMEMVIDKGNKRFYFGIKDYSIFGDVESENHISVVGLATEEEIEPDIFKFCKFETDSLNGSDFRVVEGTRNKNGHFISSTLFDAGYRQGSLRNHGFASAETKGNLSFITFYENNSTGEVTNRFRTNNEETPEELVDMIDNSEMFKDLVGVFYPKLNNYYQIYKENNIGRSR